MQLGMIGLGRMGANMVRRLMKAGHECVVYNRSPGPVEALVTEGAVGTRSLAELVEKLSPPRAVWLMVPAAVVKRVIDDLSGLLEPGDAIIDGGNSRYTDTVRRAEACATAGRHFVDAGTSGGIWGITEGYSMMVGGSALRAAAIEEKRQSYLNASENGFKVGTYEEMLPTADIVMNLAPDKQHTNGANWPVMLLGNCGGAFKTGCFTQVEGRRPINALYTSILRASGVEVDRFNMNEKMAAKFDSGSGPLREVLA